jgi:mRNA interferase HigB
MRVNSKKSLRTFWERPGQTDSEQPLRAWHAAAVAADWASPADVKADYGNANIIGNNRVVFNIAGNKYRLVVRINYPYRVVYVRFVGSHAACDKTDVATA